MVSESHRWSDPAPADPIADWPPERRQRAVDVCVSAAVHLLKEMEAEHRLACLALAGCFTAAEIEDASAYMEALDERTGGRPGKVER